MWALGGAISEEDKLDRTQTAQVLRRSLQFARPYRRTIWWAMALVSVSVGCVLAGPVFLKMGLDRGIAKGSETTLNLAVAGYFVSVVVAYFVGRAQYLAINRAGEGFLRDLRVTVFDRLQAQSMAFFDRNKAGVLVARMTADIESMAELIQWGLLQFVGAGLLLVMTLVLMTAMSWQLTLVVVVFVAPILGVASYRFQRASNVAYLTVRERVGQNLSSLQEGISGVRVIQAYGREEEQTRRFVGSSRELYASHLRGVRISTWYFGLVEWSGIASIALIIGVGGYFVHDGSVPFGGCCVRAAGRQPVRPGAATLAAVQHGAERGSVAQQAVHARRHGARRRRAPAPGGPATQRCARRPRHHLPLRRCRASGAAQRVDRDRSRRARGAGRSDGCRQEHAGEAALAPVRPDFGLRQLRRHRPTRRVACIAS